MKKFAIFLALILLTTLLAACELEEENDGVKRARYDSLIAALQENQKFLDKAEYFTISSDMAKTEDGYRYYIFIDKPRIALYDIEAIAVADDIDYSKEIAPNISILDDEVYNMIPNQTNVAKNYVEGIVLSGMTKYPNTAIKMYVQWKNRELSETSGAYYAFHIDYAEALKLQATNAAGE